MPDKIIVYAECNEINDKIHKEAEHGLTTIYNLKPGHLYTVYAVSICGPSSSKPSPKIQHNTGITFVNIFLIYESNYEIDL